MLLECGMLEEVLRNNTTWLIYTWKHSLFLQTEAWVEIIVCGNQQHITAAVHAVETGNDPESSVRFSPWQMIKSNKIDLDFYSLSIMWNIHEPPTVHSLIK